MVPQPLSIHRASFTMIPITVFCSLTNTQTNKQTNTGEQTLNVVERITVVQCGVNNGGGDSAGCFAVMTRKNKPTFTNMHGEGGAVTSVGWQITLCDPIDKWRPVVLR